MENPRDRVTSGLQAAGRIEDHHDEDASESRVLDVQRVKERYAHFHSIKHGYIGLTMFLFFMFSYVWILGKQHRARSVGGPNEAFQIYLEKQKLDLKVTDAESLYNLMSTKVIPGLLTGYWKGTTESGLEVAGGRGLGFFYVVGGFVITAVKGQAHNCFRGNPCYEDKVMDAPHYNITLTGDPEPFSVPFSHVLGGYSVNVPTSSDKAAVKSLLAAYTGLFGPDTREIWVDAVLFNPNGEKSMTSLRYGGAVSLDGNLQIMTKLLTIPYHWYQVDGKTLQIVSEVACLCFALWAFVIPLVSYIFCEPKLDAHDGKMTKPYRLKWVAWSNTWKHLPMSGGRPHIKMPMTLYATLISSLIFWVFLGFLHRKMGFLGDADVDWLFVDPLAGTGSCMRCKVDHSLKSMHKTVLPYVASVKEISLAYERYFFLHVLIMTLMVSRLQQYFSFQKRLAVVTDTFKNISDDLLHMGVLTVLVCFFFGVINSLAFGVYDPAFQDFSTSFKEMFLVCFGLYKPAAGTPFILSLFKYTPHTLTQTEFMSWVPIVLQVCFKTLVILLLFKLLMGVIMEGYKSSAKLKAHAPTLRHDLYELFTHTYQYVVSCRWSRGLYSRPHVPIFHLALALSRLSKVNRPWQRYFLGMEHPVAIMNALNAVLEGDVEPEVSPTSEDLLPGSVPGRVPSKKRSRLSVHTQAKMEDKGLRRCTMADVDYVLRVYGTNRDRAVVKFKELWKESKRKELMADDDIKTQAHLDAEAEEERIAAKVEGTVSEIELQLEVMRREELEQMRRLCLECGTPHSDEAQVCSKCGAARFVASEADYPKEVLGAHKIREDLPDERLRKVFDEYDNIGLGTVDHYLMPLIFRQLEFQITSSKLAKLLADYDKDLDACSSFKEFREMVADDRLLGHYMPQHRSSSHIAIPAAANSSAATPLLQA